jgi:hypothetical protein
LEESFCHGDTGIDVIIVASFLAAREAGRCLRIIRRSLHALG